MSRRIVPLLAALAALSLLAGCTRPVSHAYSGRVNAAAGSGATAGPSITMVGTDFDVQTAGTVTQATFDAAWAGVLATLNAWLQAGVLTPLRTGGPAGDLAPLFTALAVGRVTTGPDRAAFIDEGLPPASDVRSDAAVAGLTALAGTDGTMSVVTARLDLRLRAQASGAPVTVSRSGELVLLPEGGTWRIDGYDIRASRTFAGAPTTTTTARA